jgi:hypothetical protein
MFTTAGPALFTSGTKSGRVGAAEAVETRNMIPVTVRAAFLRMPFMQELLISGA